MRKILLCVTLLSSHVYANDYFTNHIKSLGFNDFAHYEKNKQYCFSLFDSKTTTLQLNSQCGFDMQCLQQEADVFMARQTELMSSKEWLDYGCDKIMELEVALNKNGSADCDDESGEVIKEDVCGAGNAIIETDSGWYVAAEHYSGAYLYEGDQVCGNLTTYGFEDICRDDDCGNFYIEDYESSIESAHEELCD